jgi:6-phosphogluconolactonase
VRKNPKMSDVQIKADHAAISVAAAELTVKVLSETIARNGQVHWLLSGGTAPMEAYRLLASTYRDQIDWAKVVVALGDERCVPFDSPDATWPLINQALLNVVKVPENHQLRPKSNQRAEKAAEDYAHMLGRLVSDGDGVPHFDLVWLGMGEDGHTLSLFPGDATLTNTESLVVAVHNAPKPPPDRISLSLSALSGTDNCLILAAGKGKADVIARVFDGDETLPINRAVGTIEIGGGKVTWLLDEAAANLIK